MRQRSKHKYKWWLKSCWAGLASLVLGTMLVSAQSTTCALSDFNCDAQPDLVWRNIGASSPGRNGVWLMQGITFQLYVELPAETDLNWELGGNGDLSKPPDRKPDLVWRNKVTGANRVWLMNGTTRQSIVNLPAEPDLNWQIVGAEDTNGDRQADIFWRNKVTGANRVWIMSGTTRKSSVNLPTESDVSWRIVGVGDSNGDRRPDLYWQKATGEVRIWQMKGTQLLATLTLPSLNDPNWQIQCARDLSSDGKAEVLWRNTLSGENAVWYLEGNQVTSTVHLPAATPLLPVDRTVTAGLAGDPVTQGNNMLWFYD